MLPGRRYTVSYCDTQYFSVWRKHVQSCNRLDYIESVKGDLWKRAKYIRKCKNNAWKRWKMNI